MYPIMHCEKECTTIAPEPNSSWGFLFKLENCSCFVLLCLNIVIIVKLFWLAWTVTLFGLCTIGSQEGQRSGAVIKWWCGFENYNNRVVKVMALTTFADFKWGLTKLMQNDNHKAKSSSAKGDDMWRKTFGLCSTKQKTHKSFEQNTTPPEKY